MKDIKYGVLCFIPSVLLLVFCDSLLMKLLHILIFLEMQIFIQVNGILFY